ncbi:hypothetical protein CYY_008973 [Polysphondylium violaceum]|uniref:Uncharacterized protein n=1 Tax=Polysphondylium violaceum TaxID=133409 RepID=A0A8J4UPT7_9MYCE|nr:hypothetical protein CYY_008973 [Polysphondylium violaceum]
MLLIILLLVCFFFIKFGLFNYIRNVSGFIVLAISLCILAVLTVITIYFQKKETKRLVNLVNELNTNFCFRNIRFIIHPKTHTKTIEQQLEIEINPQFNSNSNYCLILPPPYSSLNITPGSTPGSIVESTPLLNSSNNNNNDNIV